MKIKFVKPDPRAGQVVQLEDAARIAQFIDGGNAVEFDGKEVEAVEEAKPKQVAKSAKAKPAK